MATHRSLQIAAQAWCSEKNKDKIMDPDLVEEFARLMDIYIDTGKLIIQTLEGKIKTLEGKIKTLED